MGEPPHLHIDGSVRFSGPPEGSLWEQGPGRGLLMVRSERALLPLEPLTIRLEVDGFGTLVLEAEVIRPDPDRAVLRLVAGPVALPRTDRAFAMPAAVITAATNPFAPTAAVIGAAVNPFASPSTMPAAPAPPLVTGDDDDGVVPPAMAPPSAWSTAPAVIAAPEPALPVVVVAPEPPPAPPVVLLVVVAPEPPPAPPVVVVAPDPPVVVVTPEPPPPAPVVAPEPPPPAPTAQPEPPPNAPVSRPVPVVEELPRAAAIVPVMPGTPVATIASVTTTATATAAIAVPGLAVMGPPVAPAAPRPAVTLPAANATQAVDAAPLRTALPPFFSGDCLRFVGPEDLRAGQGDLLTVGALLAVSEAPAPSAAVAVRLAVGAVETRGRVQVTVTQAQRGTVVVQAVRRDDWRAVLDELDGALRGAPAASSATPSTAPASHAAPAGVVLQFPRSGTVTNPLTVQGILAMPLHRSVTEHDLTSPSVPLLLRWLRTTRGIFRLDLTAEGQPAHTCLLVDGREVRTPVSLATLGKSMAANRSTYALTELPRAPTMSHTGRALHLIVEVVRGLLAPHDPDEIAAAFPHTKDLRPVRAVGSVADALGFGGAHARLVKSCLQGDETVVEVARGAAGARTAWDVLVALELFGGLAFSHIAPDATPLTSQGDPVGGDHAARPALLDKDHFGALGLHWSCSPADIHEAWQRARREYGQGGPKRPADPRVADELMKRLEEAWRVLGTGESRRAYRRATFNMVWPHQAQLLLQQARLAIYRNDAVEARNLLEAAQDMAPTPEGEHLLALLQK